MNKIEKLHQKAIDNTEIYTEADNYLIAEKSAEITKDIAIKYKEFWLKQDVEFFDNTEQGDIYKTKRGKKITESDLFDKFIETL